jgi:glycosyltransferase involved in cell wall biosynthesis
MGQLKSAWELASERIIASSYAKKLALEKEKKIKAERERLASLPDFVIDWERKQKEDYFEGGERVIEDVEKNPTKLIRKPLKNIQQGHEEMPNNTIKVVDEETISYKSMPEVHWYGHFTSYGGFSRMNRALAFGLSNRGVKIKTDIQKCAVDVNPATQEQLEILSNVEIDPKAPKVFGATLPISMLHGGKKILYTMMETSETLHKDYVDRINLFDEVWVPTSFGARIFKKNGVTRPILVMPLGVDIERYNENAKPYDFHGELNKFVFISVFKWGHRKGYDILLKAYMEEFSQEDDVSLLLVTRCETDPNPDRIKKDFKNLRSGIDKPDEDLPHIVFHTQHVPEKDLPRFYTASNAFVMISRGEGFGLPYYEAGSCGIPVIASNCSAQSDILNVENSFLVDPDGFSKVKVNGYMSGLAKHCKFYEDQAFPDFGQNAIAQTKEHMRYVYENYKEALEKADLLKAEVRDNFSWDKSVDRILTRIKEIQ